MPEQHMQMAEESGGQQEGSCHRRKATEETAHGQGSSCPRLGLATLHQVCTLDHRWPLPGQVEGRSRDITNTVGCRIKREWEIRSLSQRRHHMVCSTTPTDNWVLFGETYLKSERAIPPDGPHFIPGSAVNTYLWDNNVLVRGKRCALSAP